MSTGTDTRRLSGMHSSEVFLFAPKCMPDKIAGQEEFSAIFRSAFFIGKMGG
jgi:hypothetical protein